MFKKCVFCLSTMVFCISAYADGELRFLPEGQEVSLQQASEAQGCSHAEFVKKLYTEKLHIKSFKAGFNDGFKRNISAEDIEGLKGSVKWNFVDGKKTEVTEEKHRQASFDLGVHLSAEAKSVVYGVSKQSYDKGFEQCYRNGIGQFPQYASAELLIMQYELDRRNKGASQRLEATNAFLSKNAKKPDITVTESGLQYRVIRVGKGKSPKASNELIVVSYVVRTLNSDEKFEVNNLTMPVGGNALPKGWKEMFYNMREGGRYELFVPPELGYRYTHHSPAFVLKNDLLITEFELIEVLGSSPVAQHNLSRN